MKVFLPISTTQELKVRTRRKSNSVTLSIRQEITDTTTEQSLIGFFTGGYFVLAFSYPFEEDTGYEMSISDSEGDIWRGKAYATTQNPQEFKLNTGILTA